MNTQNQTAGESWQQAMMQAVTDPRELLEMLALDPALLPSAIAAAKIFPLKVPRSFLARIQKSNPDDPLLKQILPLGEELVMTEGFDQDPLGETNTNPIPGLLHKYQGRVLLTLAVTCGINCRYCFRRHFPYKENNPGSQGWDAVMDYIANDPSITEVILSGGDPLVVSDYTLKNFAARIATIPHVKRLRIHTRLPIVLPERITSELTTWLKDYPLKTIFVMHCNHPQEITPAVKTAMQQLKHAGVVLLNQSVLLKGVNDSAETLIELSEALFAADIQPYYLHILDKVQGAAHFDLARTTARQLHQTLSHQLPGYLVPKLVYEQAGAPAKISIAAIELCTD